MKSETRPFAVLVFFNARANQGRAWKKLKALREKLPSPVQNELDSAKWIEVFSDEYRNAINNLPAGQKVVVAGGDGTLHSVVNDLFQTGVNLSALSIGFIGVGSSCDFLKWRQDITHPIFRNKEIPRAYFTNSI